MADSTQPPTPLPPSPDRVNVLMVDDRTENLMALEAILEAPDYHLVRAGSGAEALRQVLERDFAVILLDVQMPRMDGFECAQLIKERPGSAHTPIIFITAISKEEKFVFTGYATGAVDYLIKPFNPDILRAKVGVFADLFRKNRELRRLNDELRLKGQLLDLARDFIFVLNPDGRMVYVNEAASRSAGYHPSEIMGKKVWETLFPILASQVEQHLAALEGEGERVFETVLTPRHGPRVPVEVHACSLEQAGGRQILGIARNIKLRKQVERVLRRSRDQLEKEVKRRTKDLEAAKQGLERQAAVLAGLNRIHREALTCKTMEELGHTCLAVAEEITGSKFGFIATLNGQGRLTTFAMSDPGWEACRLGAGGDLVMITDMELRGLFGQVIKEGRILLTNYPAGHPDRVETPAGHPPISAFLGAPLLQDGRPVGMVALTNKAGGYGPADQEAVEALTMGMVEAVMRKKAELELIEHRDHLENLVGERTAEVDEARGQAETASRAKSDFLANMSHELRTPLNSILGFSEVLQDQMFGPVNDKQQQYLGHILTSGRHLLSLINDILDLAKVESGKMEAEYGPLKVQEALSTSMLMVKEKAMKHGLELGLELGVPEDLEIVSDVRKLKQVLFNLLSNAVKFTPDGGLVTVRAGWADLGTPPGPGRPDLRHLGDRGLEISVEDTGVGIKAEDLPRLFQEFSQLDRSVNQPAKGTGLGLALSKKMVELLGGVIWAESEYGKGSRFSFVLPVSAQNLAPAGSP